MKPEEKTLTCYRLKRATEALEEADLLLNAGHTNTAVNRLYYACFYAVSALLLTQGMISTKHAGIRSLFNRHFVKTGKIAKEQGDFYRTLFDNRQKGDYQDLIQFDAVQVARWFDKAKVFVKIISQLAKNETEDRSS